MKYISVIILSISFVYGDIVTETLNTSKAIYKNLKSESYSIYTNLKNESYSIYNELIKDQEENSSKRFNKIWNKVKKNLLEGVNLYEKRERVPDNTYIFGEDKKDVDEDINELLNETISILINKDLLYYQQRMEELNKKIKKYKLKIAEYREEMISADNQDLYDKKIEKIKKKIDILNNEISMLKDNLKKKFQKIGIELNSEQIDVLLIRADGHDIIQLMLIIDTIKQINEQILKLVRANDEDLVHAKRYYGMHMVSLMLVSYTQKLYINKIKKVYIPRIDKIIQKASQIMEKTKELISKEDNTDRLYTYRKNLEAQEFTKQVAIEYKNDLLKTIDSIKKAYIENNKSLELAQNTYDTVSLSSGLYNIINETQKMFDKINKIQIPQIVPFENTQIKRKYKELTKQILIEN